MRSSATCTWSASIRSPGGWMTLTERIDEAMEPFRVAREFLATIPGVSILVADVIIAETGADMSTFETPGRLASWAGLSPGSNESAGRTKSTKTRPGNRYLKGALGIAALTIARHPKGTLSRGALQAARRAPRQDEGHRRHRAFHPHRRLAHARRGRVLPRPRIGLLHPKGPDPHQEQRGPPPPRTRLRRHPEHPGGSLTHHIFVLERQDKQQPAVFPLSSYDWITGLLIPGLFETPGAPHDANSQPLKAGSAAPAPGRRDDSLAGLSHPSSLRVRKIPALLGCRPGCWIATHRGSGTRGVVGHRDACVAEQCGEGCRVKFLGEVQKRGVACGERLEIEDLEPIP